MDHDHSGLLAAAVTGGAAAAGVLVGRGQLNVIGLGLAAVVVAGAAVLWVVVAAAGLVRCQAAHRPRRKSQGLHEFICEGGDARHPEALLGLLLNRARQLAGAPEPELVLLEQCRTGAVRTGLSGDGLVCAGRMGNATLPATARSEPPIVGRLPAPSGGGSGKPSVAKQRDGLTGLPDRRRFLAAVEETAVASPRGLSAAVVVIGLSSFKEVNDTLGHSSGDRLLVDVAGRLRGLDRRAGTAARLGGDEFAVLIPGVADSAEALRAARDVRGALEPPFALRDLHVDVGASVGVALGPLHGRDAGTLLRHAALAMRAAKAGSSGVEVYDPRRDAPCPRRLGLAAELREAIDSEALTVHYQPKVELVASTVVGVEALLRWHHPVHGAVAPDEFVRVAERSDLIRQLTRFVLRTALAQREAWRLAGRELDMAVNLSVRDLLDRDLPDDVAHLLGRFNVPTRALTLEVTESGIVADHTPAVAVLSTLRDLGVQVSIDDFGTGYSSLSHLKRLPADELKVDRSFVTAMASDPGDARIVRSIIDLAHSFGLRVVAEGVEDEVTWHRLRALRCDVIQGYLLTPPLTAPGLWRWLAEREASPTAAGAAAGTRLAEHR